MKAVPIAEARRLAKEHGAQRLIVLAVGDGQFNWTSYGATRSDCQALQDLAGNVGESWALRINDA